MLLPSIDEVFPMDVIQLCVCWYVEDPCLG
ncbi:hypothetical protein QF000_004030 [Paraburkholderia atlantica]|uniref:Uncharacterized protein n=2 Tax=Paraburkholderia atlantica TaxID=2654982 RepID=A0A7W8Q534_PARAM|nr:hypothetical protein [Paraburkholderia atlantica]